MVDVACQTRHNPRRVGIGHLARVPGLRQPGAATGQVVELIDLYPTLLDLAGLPAPAGLEGVMVMRVTRGGGVARHGPQSMSTMARPVASAP